MFSFSAVVIALLLIPTVLCIFILQLFFPKHTLKISEAHLIPFGLGLTLLCNLNRIFHFIELFNPPSCFPKEVAEQTFIENIISHRSEIVWEYLNFIFVPVAIFTFVTMIISFSWRAHIKNPNRVWIIRFIAKKVDEVLVSYMGKMTAHFPKQRGLFVDVLDKHDSLYSGIFLEYHTEDKKLAGIQLSNVMRFSFKSEKDRRNLKDAKSNEKTFPPPYLMPNNGRMFFPIQDVQNFHFWTIASEQKQEFYIDTPDKQVRFSWMLGMQYSLPHLNLSIKGFLYNDDDQVDISSLIKAFNTLGLPENCLLDNLEWKKREAEHPPTKPPASDS